MSLTSRTHCSAPVVARVGVRRWPVLVLAAATMGWASFGCEQKTDEELSATTAKGASQVASGRSAEAVSTLSAVTSTEGAPGVTLAAKFILGHAKADLAAESEIALLAAYLDIARLTSEIAEIGQAVAVGNTLVDGYRKQDPAEARARIRDRLAEAQGGAGKDVWVDTGKYPIPTLAAARQKLSAAQSAVAAKQSEVRALLDKRKAALAEADELRLKVDGLARQEAVDAFARAANARKAVSLVSGEIDVAEGQLAILLREQQIAEGQVAVVERYIAHLQAQDKAIAAGFEQVTAQITNQVNVSKVAVEAPAQADLAVSIAAKTVLLAARYEEAETLFAATEKLYNEAAAEYQAAFNEAGRLRAELQTRSAASGNQGPFTKAMISSLQNTTAPTEYRQQQCVALARIADLRARRAEVMAAKEGVAALLKPTLEKLGIALPAGLQGDLTAATKSAQQQAIEAYTKAASEFEGVAGGIQGSDADAGRRRIAVGLAQMFHHYGWSQFLTTTGDSAGAAEKLKAALVFRDGVASEPNVKMPTLPGPLAIAPTTAPAEPPAQ